MTTRDCRQFTLLIVRNGEHEPELRQYPSRPEYERARKDVKMMVRRVLRQQTRHEYGAPIAVL